jgi:hypothetical protein
LTNMTPSTDWVWVPQLGRWANDFSGTKRIGGFLDPFINGGHGSVFMWIYSRASEAYKGWIASVDTTFTGGFVIWRTNVDGRTQCRLGTSGAFTATVASGDHIVLNEWTHYGFTYDQAVMRVYKNGREIGTSVTATGVLQAAATFYVNRSYAGNENCISCDPLIYNRAISASEIAQLADPSNVMLSGLILPPRRRLWAVPAAPSGEQIDATLGEVEIESHSATVLQGTLITVALGEVDVEPHDATVSQGTLITAALGEVEIEAHGAAVSQGMLITAALGEVEIEPHNATVLQGTLIDAALGEVEIEAHGAAISQATLVEATLGRVAIAGYPAVIGSGAATFQPAWAAGINLILGA